MKAAGGHHDQQPTTLLLSLFMIVPGPQLTPADCNTYGITWHSFPVLGINSTTTVLLYTGSHFLQLPLPKVNQNPKALNGKFHKENLITFKELYCSVLLILLYLAASCYNRPPAPLSILECKSYHRSVVSGELRRVLFCMMVFQSTIDHISECLHRNYNRQAWRNCSVV